MFIKFTHLKCSRLYVEAEGKLDIYNAPDYLDEITEHIKRKYANELILEFSKISYIASIGLRSILELHKFMQERNGIMKLRNVNEDILYTLQITGFDDFLNIDNDSEDITEEDIAE